MAKRPRSLRTRLITRLIFLQALVLLLFSLATVYALFTFNESGTRVRVLDPRDADIVAEAVERAPGGMLVVAETPDLRQLRQEAPGLWFVLQDTEGRRATEGDVPALLRPIAADLSRFGRSYISESTTRPSGDSAAIIVPDTAAGTIYAMVGGGRRVGFATAYIIAASRFIIPLAIILSVVTMIAIAWIIRRELRGVAAAAAEADRIDINQRGARLPDEGLPREVQPVVKAVNAALERLDEGYARQKRFLAYAAHELKTPIAILQTRLETTSGAERDRLLMDVARLGNLVEQLLDTQRLEHGADAKTTVDLVRLAEQVAADLAPLVISAGYELSFHKEISSYPVAGDWASLEHVVSNLVQNAVTHGGGSGTIVMRVERDGTLEVADEGPGVPFEERDKIFEPFYRVRPRDRGTGLGLSLVDDIVRRHSGHVTVGDAPEGGALFRVSLPRAL